MTSSSSSSSSSSSKSSTNLESNFRGIVFFLSLYLLTFVNSSRILSQHKPRLHLDDSLTFLWPLPSQYTSGNQTLTVDPNLSLVVSGNGGGSMILKEAFERYKYIIFRRASKVSKLNVPSYDVQKLSVIVHSDNEELQLGTDESYSLLVAKSDERSIIGEVTIEANSVYGALRALETLSQLCVFDSGTKSITISKAPWFIQDKPRFEYRGLLLDTSRHYYPIDVIKQIIESMSYAKLNVLHWHIIDEESFPLEVPGYPNLWKGAYSKWERYTVEDAQEIVQFAKMRGINIMAEVDVPGHAESWGKGYPDLWPSPSCTEPLDISKNFTFEVISGLLADMRKIFPFKLFHLGGDEVNTDCWTSTPHVKEWLRSHNMTAKDAYRYFVLKAQEIALSNDWIPVNWEETFNSFSTKLNPQTVVHNWLGPGVCPKVVEKGLKCIFSNQGVWYLDHLDVTWDEVYFAEPLEGIYDITKQQLVLGGEVCMWGETADASNVQQTIWPRAAAAADYQRSSGIVNASSEHVPASENVDSIVTSGSSVNISVPNSNEDWHSCFQKSAGETADIFIELDSLGDFLPDSSTVLDNAITASEAPAGHVPVPSNTEGRLAINDSTCFSNVSGSSSQPEISAAQDPLTGSETIITTDHGGCPADNGELETEKLESYPCVKTLEMSDLTNGSEKFQPKPRLQTERCQSNISNADLVVSISTAQKQQDVQSVPLENSVMDQGSVPPFTQNVFDFSSVELSGPAAESASEFIVDKEQTSPAEPSHPGLADPVEHLQAAPELTGKLASRRAKARKGTDTVSDLCPKQCTSNQAEGPGRSLRKQPKNKNVYELQDNSEEEAAASGDLHSESPGISNANQYSNGDEDFQPEHEPQTKKVQRKSKKNQGDKEKPVRKRKKDNETSDQAPKAAPKKFYHSTRRRKVNKTLLETPEDDIDYQKVPLRDLILLAEHKERMAKKDATASQASLPNQSASNSVEPDKEERGGADFQQYYDDEPFSSEQGGEANNEESNPRVEESSGYFNYQTYMDKTPVMRWSKQDTELFYKAVGQFGTDLTMIQQLFPGRTRRQVKLKYKKEERQHPSKLRDALTSRPRDHSQYELLIGQLCLQTAGVKQNSDKADAVELTGDEEMEEETPETNNNEEKSGQIDEDIVDYTEEEFTKAESPVKTCDSEDDMFHWNQYKCED